jgi:hypothetical protein
MGAYMMQGRMVGGRPTYKGGRDDDMWVWHHADQGMWCVGSGEATVGTAAGQMYVKDSAATPDAVQGTWNAFKGYTRNKGVTVTQIAGNSTLLPAIALLTSGATWQAGPAFESQACPRAMTMHTPSATTRSSRGRKGAGRRTREGRGASRRCGTTRKRGIGGSGTQKILE